jgi:mRNA interferase HigB
MAMRVISRRRLVEFADKHPQARVPLDHWYHAARQAAWQSLADVRRVYPHADLVGTLTVFNIAGNKYRLMTSINYQTQIIYIRTVQTHAEYDKGGRKR